MVPWVSIPAPVKEELTVAVPLFVRLAPEPMEIVAALSVPLFVCAAPFRLRLVVPENVIPALFVRFPAIVSVPEPDLVPLPLVVRLL